MASLQDDAVQDLVQDFLDGERRLLEKEAERQPTTGSRPPTRGRFALVDRLLAEHAQRGTLPEDLDAELIRLANDGDGEERQQARDMLTRWRTFRELGQPLLDREPLAPAGPSMPANPPAGHGAG
jgi:hypothetical protein